MGYTIDLSGKVAIVTGAAKGIGEATAAILAQAGAQVVIDDIVPEEEVLPVLDQIGRSGPRPFYIQEDISIEENAHRMVAKTLAQFGRVDILVNNAGVVAGWQKSLDVHIMGIYYCAEAVRDHMAERGDGRIINLTSTCVFSGGTGIPQYVASKGGAYSLTRYLARTYAPLGVLVNGVMPAVIMSDMIMTRYKTTEEMIEHYQPIMPIRRIGYPQDIAGIILFLSCELSSFLVGEIIVADGGRMHVGV
jgi:3-oxoacyl-[acyl-carrier protein] reductase